MSGTACLVLDIKLGDRVLIGGNLVTIELLQKSGQLARLKVTAPAEVSVKKDAIASRGFVPRMTR
jgi:sRNA-binding carbon storage regulator CsrA